MHARSSGRFFSNSARSTTSTEVASEEFHSKAIHPARHPSTPATNMRARHKNIEFRNEIVYLERCEDYWLHKNLNASTSILRQQFCDHRA